MAIIQCVTTSCKSEILSGIHVFNSHTIKVALYTDEADLGPDTTEYTANGEVVGLGYTAGGVELPTGVVEYSNGAAWVNWQDPSWPGADFYASGALFYNASADNRSVLILNFGRPVLFNGDNSTLRLPRPTASTALMRIV